MNNLPLILQLLCGGVSANIAGARFHDFSLGSVANFLIGLVGGGCGGSILMNICAIGVEASETQIFLTCVAGGAIGGVLMFVMAGLIKSAAHRR